MSISKPWVSCLRAATRWPRSRSSLTDPEEHGGLAGLLLADERHYGNGAGVHEGLDPWLERRAPAPALLRETLSGRLQLLRRVDVHEQFVRITELAAVQIQVPGVEIGVDVEDAPASRVYEGPVGVQGAFAVHRAQRLHELPVPGHEHVVALGAFGKLPEKTGRDEWHVAGQADHPFSGRRQDGRVETDRGPRVG